MNRLQMSYTTPVTYIFTPVSGKVRYAYILGGGGGGGGSDVRRNGSAGGRGGDGFCFLYG